MSTVADFHTHVLPKIDDGSASIQESLEMLRMEAEQGIRHVVATPHFYAQSDRPNQFLARREASVRRLRDAMAEFPELPRLSVGAEVHYFQGIGDADILPELAIDHGRFVLVEMPMTSWTNRMYRDLQNIYDNLGLIPIVAHVDRYIGPMRTYGIPERLAEMPVLIQANASFFRHFLSRRLALRMLEKGQIHLLGSDCHNLRSRKPNLGAARERIARKLGADALSWIDANGREVLK